MNTKESLQNNFIIVYTDLTKAVEKYIVGNHTFDDLRCVNAYLAASVHALMDYAERFMNSDKVALTVVPIPPIDEQKRIARRIEEMLPYVDQLIKE